MNIYRHNRNLEGLKEPRHGLTSFMPIKAPWYLLVPKRMPEYLLCIVFPVPEHHCNFLRDKRHTGIMLLRGILQLNLEVLFWISISRRILAWKFITKFSTCFEEYRISVRFHSSKCISGVSNVHINLILSYISQNTGFRSSEVRSLTEYIRGHIHKIDKNAVTIVIFQI